MKYLLFLYFILNSLNIIYCYKIKNEGTLVNFYDNFQHFKNSLDTNLQVSIDYFDEYIGKEKYYQYGVGVNDNEVLYYKINYIYKCNIQEKENCKKDFKTANNILISIFCQNQNNTCNNFGSYSAGALYIEYKINEWPENLDW